MPAYNYATIKLWLEETKLHLKVTCMFLVLRGVFKADGVVGEGPIENTHFQAVQVVAVLVQDGGAVVHHAVPRHHPRPWGTKATPAQNR